jgi:addiction module RelB/DinJ family antitoxin
MAAVAVVDGQSRKVSPNIQIRYDVKKRAAAESILDTLGLDLTTAIRAFLNQVILQRGLPFDVKIPVPSEALLKAIGESYGDQGMSAPTTVNEMFAEAEAGPKRKRKAI